MRKILLLAVYIAAAFQLMAQDIPEHISYIRIYEFLDELATDGFIDLNTSVKPYSRSFIVQKLLAVDKNKLNKRQRSELAFYLNEYSLEQGKLPKSSLRIAKNENLELAFWQPVFHYRDTVFRARITPLLGMHITANDNGNIIKRWYGADFQGMIGKHVSVYGSLRDVSINGDLLAGPTYLNDYPGYEYKESTSGGDYSDSRGGIKYAWKSGSVGLVKDNVIWGDNYHGSNILSGRTPSFPMLALHLKPAKWFEMQYFHGWLVSNVVDSTNYYLDNQENRQYRMANKFIAANMFTITPVPRLHFSFGNSIIYAEQNLQPGYFIPIAFYKSIDHTLTKGAGLENQNSQVFMNISSRNIRHLHLFTSIFADEISMSRFKPSVPQKNPISLKVGANLTNFVISNLTLTGEYTRTGIITYKHSIPALTWASNGYNLGSYLGDNSQELYLGIGYKPLRGLDFTFSYVDAKHGNEFNYIRRNNKVDNTKIFLAQPVLGEISWSNKTFAFNTRYEIINNAYAMVNIQYSNIQGYDLTSTPIAGDKAENLQTAQGYLDLFTPKYLQGRHTTLTLGFGFGF